MRGILFAPVRFIKLLSILVLIVFALTACGGGGGGGGGGGDSATPADFTAENIIYFYGDVSTIINNEFSTNTSNLMTGSAGVEYNSVSVNDYRQNHRVTVLLGKVTNDSNCVVTINLYHPDADHPVTPRVHDSFDLEQNESVYLYDGNYSIGSDFGISASCSNGNNLDTIAPVITLNGETPVSIAKDSAYVDAGASAIDNKDGVVAVTTSGTVDTSTVGTYTITYTAKDSAGNTATATRTVQVVSNGNNLDTIAPVITLNGATPVSIAKDSAYVDAGASATDNKDGVVAVTTSGAVDTSTVGTYTITYTAKDSAGNTSTAKRTIYVVNVTISISAQPPASGKNITQIIGGQDEIEYAAGSNSQLNVIADTDYLITALNDEQKLEWLGVAKLAQTNMDLGPESTAFALIVLYPYISSLYQENPDFVIDIIMNQDPKVPFLEEAIRNTPSWSSMDDDTFINVYTETLISVISKLNELTPPSTLFAGAVVLPDYDYKETSGVKVSFEEGYPAPSLTIEIDNTFNRYAKALISKDQFSIDHMMTFDLPGKKSVSKPIAINEVPKEGFWVEVIGPGSGGKLPSPNHDEDYWYATYATLLHEVAIPGLGLILGSESCVKTMFGNLHLSNLLLQKISINPSLETQIKNGEWFKAGTNVLSLGGEAVLDSVGTCFHQGLKKTLLKLFPVIGQLYVAADAMYTLGNPTLDWFNSNEYESWWVNNEVDLLGYIDIAGSGYLPKTDIQKQGKKNYSYSYALDSYWKSFYKGDCPQDENTTCAGYTYYYDHDGPYSVSFEAICTNPKDDTNIVPCSKAIYVPDGNPFAAKTFTADNDGVVRFTYDYSEVGEHQDVIEFVDYLDAVKRRYFYTQIKKAAPQVVIRHNGSELDYNAFNNELTIKEPFEIYCCDIGKDSVTSTFELFNKGQSTAYVGEPVLIGSNPAFSLSGPSKNLIPPESSVTFQVTYTPSLNNSNLESPEVSIRFEGSDSKKPLGRRSLNPPLYTAIDYDYDTIFLDLVGKEIDATIMLQQTQHEYWGGLPAEVVLSDIGPRSSSFLGTNCYERGYPFFSNSVEQGAEFYPVFRVDGFPQPLASTKPRAYRPNCSSFIAIKDKGTPNQKVWINATKRGYMIKYPVEFDWEYQIRFYSGDPGNEEATRTLQIGTVTNTGNFVSIYDLSPYTVFSVGREYNSPQ